MHLQICFFDFQICKPIPRFRPARSKSGNALAHVVLHIDTCRMHVHVVLWSMRAFALLLDISSLQLHSYLGSPGAKCPQYKKCSKYKDLAPFWGAADMRATFPSICSNTYAILPTLPTLALQAARLAPERMHTHVASQSCVFPPTQNDICFSACGRKPSTSSCDLYIGASSQRVLKVCTKVQKRPHRTWSKHCQKKYQQKQCEMGQHGQHMMDVCCRRDPRREAE